MSDEFKTPVIDEEEYEAAFKEAENNQDTYTHTFSKPWSFESESFGSLTFDFGKLTAADSLAIEAELNSLGQPTIIPEFSGDYLIRMAMRACTDKRSDGRKLGIDAFRTLPMAAYVRIRGRARSFLLRAGS